MSLLAFEKAYDAIRLFSLFIIAGNRFFPFRHRPQKYTNNFGFKPSNTIQKFTKTIEF